MRTATASTMRELDRRTIAERGIPAEVLMDRAGLGVAHRVRLLRRQARCDETPVVLVAGRGNNGGDAFAAARHLVASGIPVEVLLAGRKADVSDTAAAHLDRASRAGIAVEERPDPEQWAVDPCVPARPRGVLVDALLGTGFSGLPRGAIASAIEWVNSMAPFHRVLSVDIPSGMDADTGEGGCVVRADMTVTLGLPKRGLLRPAGLSRAGRVEVVDIGIPADWAPKGEEDEPELIAADELRPLLPRREAAAHKGAFGTLLVIAGARGYAGAAALAARAAVVSGAGLVHVVTARSAAGIVATLVPEAMVHPVAETASGSIAATAWGEARALAAKCSAVLIGPGLTTHEAGGYLLGQALSLPLPMVLDADALNLLAGAAGSAGGREAATVLTPHPGEMARLLKMDASGVQRDRIGAIRRASEQSNATFILKGAGTLVHSQGGPVLMNLTGNPGMATGGAGDVLSGIVGAFLAGGMRADDAAKTAVYLHGVAGDMAAYRLCQASVRASDIAESIPAAFAELLFR